jgi:adenylate cyclase
MHTFLFADLCDYTAYTLRYGDQRSAELAVGFHELVRRLAAEEGCELVKVSGDATMVRAPATEHAVMLAERIHANAEEHGYPKIRIGIDTGPAVPLGGDWYGTTVNTAARVAEAAAPGELLMTDRARAQLSGVETVARGRFHLKGLPDCSLHAAGTSPAAPELTLAYSASRDGLDARVAAAAAA